MANYGAGIFLPSESNYAKDPNRFKDILAAEGNKEAKYLSEMDQFFANLDEMKREFDITSTQKNTQFEEELAFNREKLDWQSGENALDRSVKYTEINAGEQANEQKLGLEYAQLDLYGGKFKAEAAAKSQELEMAKDKNDFYKSLYMAEEQRTKDYATAINKKVSGGDVTGISGMYDYGVIRTDESGNQYNVFDRGY